MPPQFKPLPADFKLAPTLAQRLQQLRDFRNITVKDLAKSSRLGLARIEDLEAGLETWMSSSDRQLLAKALSIDPFLLQEVETKPPAEGDKLREEEARITEAILQGSRDLECPNCSGSLRCSVAEALDIDGQPTRFAKAFCTKCPFVLR